VKFISKACVQIPLEQVQKYLELLNRQQNDDDLQFKEFSASESKSLFAVSTSAATTATVSSLSTVAATEKTEVSQCVASAPDVWCVQCMPQLHCQSTEGQNQ